MQELLHLQVVVARLIPVVMPLPMAVLVVLVVLVVVAALVSQMALPE